MTNTTYYNLNIVEGTDIVNPLTVDNPNYEKIDEAMHDNAVAGVTLATEIANGTVHAITRENSECAVIRFIATSNWKAGDTATVDGVPVTALLPCGETLPDGAYVINANVLCILTGTNLTVYAERKKTDKAIDISYKESNVSMELDKLNSNLVPVKKQLTNKLWNDGTGNPLSSFYKIGKLCICHIDGYTTKVWNHGTIIATIPDDCKPIAVSTSVCLSTGGNAKFCILANANGDLHSMLTAENDSGKNILAELTWVRCTVVWLTN